MGPDDLTSTPTDFQWSKSAEPHLARRRAVLEAHGDEIKALYGADASLALKALLAVAVQLAAAYFARDLSWPAVLLLAYTLGGCVNHSMTLCMHEISHNLACEVGWWPSKVGGVRGAACAEAWPGGPASSPASAAPSLLRAPKPSRGSSPSARPRPTSSPPLLRCALPSCWATRT